MHPIVSACGTATYNTAKSITEILQNYYGKTLSFVKDSKDFIKKIKHLNRSRRRNLSLICCQMLSSPAYQYLLHYKLSIPKFLPAPVLPMSARSLQKNSSGFWNSLSPTASSASITDSINNYRVQLWVHLSPLSLQTSTWNTLNP